MKVVRLDICSNIKESVKLQTNQHVRSRMTFEIYPQMSSSVQNLRDRIASNLLNQ